ncbi:hypothetical protein NQ318_005360 [Aromia moschata]|uniref:Secreted protein n=1 Tax=Aromia moschata TaxID=1265417 RepID=A0AAV8YYL3_9CUCU|nr:hypothetical protein NQ318_005360 [Aromia moschata]
MWWCVSLFLLIGRPVSMATSALSSPSWSRNISSSLPPSELLWFVGGARLRSLAETLRKLRKIFGRNEAPSAPDVKKVLKESS